MRRMSSVALCLVVAASLGLCMSARAMEYPATVGLDVMSKYVFRGAAVVDKLSVQPSVAFDVAGSGLRLGLWGTFATQERDTYEQFDRMDFSLSYEKALGAMWTPLSFRAGFTEYTFPNGIEGSTHTEEGFVGVKLALPLVESSLTAYRDFNLLEGTYVQAGFSPPASLLAGIPIPGLDLDVNVAMSDYSDQWSFHDVTTTLGFGLPLMGLLHAGPVVGFSYADDSVSTDNTNWWAGLTLRLGE